MVIGEVSSEGAMHEGERQKGRGEARGTAVMTCMGKTGGRVWLKRDMTSGQASGLVTSGCRVSWLAGASLAEGTGG